MPILRNDCESISAGELAVSNGRGVVALADRAVEILRLGCERPYGPREARIADAAVTNDRGNTGAGFKSRIAARCARHLDRRLRSHGVVAARRFGVLESGRLVGAV